MTITITQLDQDSASSCVNVFLDGSLAATLGRGEGITKEIETDRCLVEVVCGVYFKKMIIGTNANLIVRWGINPADMVLEHATRKT